MKTWKPIYRWLAASVGFAALVTVGVVIVGPDGEQPRSTGEAQTAPAAKPSTGASGASEPDALVNRMLEQLRNGEPVESQFAPGEENPASGVPIEAIKARPGEQLQLGRLAIPRLGLDDELNNGVDEAALVQGVGHWPGTPLPGVVGNAVISGHRSTNEKPFLHLDKLRPGDPIKVTVGARTTTYKVFKTTIVPQADYVKFVLKQPTRSSDKLLTLFACNPITAHYQRIVVQARAG